MENIASYVDSDDDHDISRVEKSPCMVCNAKPFVYKCPRCSYLTCSLECCKKHKLERDCNGKRDKTAFVSVREYKDKALLSDYHFLEDTLQTKMAAQRLVINTAANGKSISSYLISHVYSNYPF